MSTFKRKIFIAVLFAGAILGRTAFCDGDDVVGEKPEGRRPAICPVHKVSLVMLVAPVEYGMPVKRYSDEELAHFPYWDRHVHGGCVDFGPKTSVTSYCPLCEKAAKEFDAKKPNQALRPTTMSVTPRACARVAPDMVAADL
jgi:hypothetical protein